MKFPSIALASRSPRRQELLQQIGVSFEVVASDVDESTRVDETPEQYVQRLAIAKAQAGWHTLAADKKCPVLGSDTAVIVDNQILGKPRDAEDAKAMLQLLSGRSHQVLTAAAIVGHEYVDCVLNTNTVTFCRLSPDQIEWYLATQEGVDKAGGYAVQGLAAMFIERIEGSYSGIMGLPLRETSTMLEKLMA